MLVINPKILFWDVGFQLSFLATVGIVYFVPLLEEAMEKWPNPWELRSIVTVTLAACLVTLPLILFQFGRLSVIAPLANILILPFVPVTMLLGFLTVLPFVGPGFAFVANIFLVYILRAVAVLASVPYSSLGFRISNWVFLVLGAGVCVCYILLRHVVSKLRQSRAFSLSQQNLPEGLRVSS
jgi:competence protein ComEC